MLGLEGARVRRLRAKLPRRALRPIGALGATADRLLFGCQLFHGVFVGAPPVSRATKKTIALSQFPTPESAARLREYDGVITFSRFAASEIAARFELDPSRVHALPVGCEHWSRELASPPQRADPPVVLVLGRVEHRRAPLAILAACRKLRAGGAKLQLQFAGRRGDAFDELRARTASGAHSASVVFTSQPDEREMPELVARASVLVHLNDVELTPVTPLEAMACGCAVVASRIPAFEEALGREVRWIDAPVDAPIDPVTTDVLASSIEAALRDAADAGAVRRRAELASRFNWRNHATLTLDVWRQILCG
jgi:glycosyltransferase involved in cell wall biosynthesis